LFKLHQNESEQELYIQLLNLGVRIFNVKKGDDLGRALAVPVLGAGGGND